MAEYIPIPSEGRWVRWVTNEFGREGQVIQSLWPSMVVKWLGVEEPQIFPMAYPHFGEGGDMRVIDKPTVADKVIAQEEKGVLGIAAAAAALGIDPKRVRQKLRDGQLKGKKIDGRWVEVWLAEG